jgi:hypothetical protein
MIKQKMKSTFQPKLLIISIVLLASFYAKAQSTLHLNLPHYDDKKIHYGFHLSMNYSSLRAEQSDWYLEQDTIASVRGGGDSGFGLGFVFSFRLFEYGDLRILPTVDFYNRTLEYTLNDGSKIVGEFKSSYVNLPILFKYKAKRRSNARVYMIGGIKPGFEVGGDKRRDNEDQISINTFDLTLEYGLGMDIYQPFFKFAPELRFSLGLIDLLNPVESIYSDALERSTTYTVTLFIMFE